MRVTQSKTWLAGVQWLLFMFANTVVIPVSVGASFHMDALSIAAFMQRAFFFTGIVSLAQVMFGHRLPLLEGQSGVWWGVIVSTLAGATASGVSLQTAGGSLELGIIIAGILLVILGALGMGRVLKRWFTPIAISVFLILLANELITIFLAGMLGISEHSPLDGKTAVLSFVLAAGVLWLTVKGSPRLSNFAILIGIVTGWILYRLWIHKAGPLVVAPVTSLVHPLPWGPLSTSMGIVFTAVITGLINATNTVTTLESAKDVLQVQPTDAMYRRAYFVTGTDTVLAGFTGLIPFAPYTSSIGFLRSTQIFDRLPFAVGAALFTVMGLIPTVGAFFATLPVSVGDAVLLVAYMQLFGSALDALRGQTFTVRSIYRIALPTLIGLAVSNLPASALVSVPALVRTFVGNGLLVGVVLAVLLENLVQWDSQKEYAGGHHGDL